MFLGAVKPYVFGFGFRVGSKICGELNQKVLYVQKLWKSLLTRGINRKKKLCPKLNRAIFPHSTQLHYSLAQQIQRHWKLFFKSTLKQICSSIFLPVHQSLQTLPDKAYSVDSINCPSSFQMLWKMLHRVDRFPTSFALLIFPGTAEHFSVCLKPAPLLGARMAAPCWGSDGLLIPCRAADVLAPILTPGNCAKLCLPHKGILNGAESELSVLKD